MEHLPNVAVSLTRSSGHNNSDQKSERLSLAKVLFACYRMTETSDPEIYAAAAIAVMSDYSIDVVRKICDPRSGLPSKCKWLPSIAEIKEACEEEIAPMLRERARQAQLKKQFEERETEAVDRSKRLTVAELRAKYGDWTEELSRGGRESEQARLARVFPPPQKRESDRDLKASELLIKAIKDKDELDSFNRKLDGEDQSPHWSEGS